MPFNERHPNITLLTGFVTAACVFIFFLEPWGHDTWFHIQRMLDIEGQISRGDWYAHFADNAAEGKGLPVWIYYSQWIYWPPILLKSLGVSTLISLKICYCILLIVCSAGCHRLLKLHGDHGLAVLGSLLFITSNYVIGDIFQRSAYAEFCSVAFLPFLLVAIHRTLLEPARGPMTALTLLAGIMVLAHPLSFMNAGWALLAYTAYVTIRCRVAAPALLRVVVLLLLALALTSFYWLPAVIETPYVLGAEGLPTPLNGTFLTIPRYLRFHSVLSLGLVLTTCAIVVAGSLIIRRGKSNASGPAASWPLVAGIFWYLFLTLRASEPLYSTVPFLASSLYVWRLLFPLTLIVVLFVVLNIHSLPRWLRGERALNGVAMLAVIQGVVFVLFSTWSDISTERLGIDEINGELAKEKTRMEGFGIDEYLPQPRVLPRAGTECPSATTVIPSGRTDLSFVIADNASACIHVPRYWNVRYAAYVSGQPIPVFADSSGEILLLPEGRSGVAELRFTRPSYVTFSAYLSVATAILLVVGLAWRPRIAGFGSKA